MVRPSPWSLPAETRARERDVGLPDLRIVGRQRLVDDRARRSGHLDDQPRDLLDRHLLRVADIDRAAFLRQHQLDDAVDEIGDVTEAARLLPVAEDRDVLVDERLRDERRHGAAIADAHARAVGVEDADDLGVDLVEAAIRDRHRLREPLGLVVDAARPDRVDVAPVGFLLRMLERIAVDLRRRGDHERRALGLREAERLVRAERSDFQRLDRQLEVIDRAGRARPVQHVIHRAVDVDEVGDVVADELEVAIAQVRDVGEVAGQQVVDADHCEAAIEQRFRQVRSDETGGAGNDYPWHD